MEYTQCTALQRTLLEEVAEGADDALIFVEHPPVLTLGANFHEANLRLDRSQYADRGIDIQPTERGGDVTFHNPGQLVIYPVFNVGKHGKDLHKWLRDLEEAVILALSEFGLGGGRFPPNTGVWVTDKKVAAIGIKIRRWVSMHGIALNCNNDLDPFSLIWPCGIKEYGVASLSSLMGRDIGTADAKAPILRAFSTVFGLEFEQASV